MRRRKRGTRSGGTRLGLAALIALFMAILVMVGLLLIFAPSGGGKPGKRAIIVDQLAQTNPDPDFINGASDMLNRAGYVVDYVPKESVTVDLYRRLPTLGYDLIILRSHAASYLQDSSGGKSRGVALFTNQPYSPRKYVTEQRAQALSSAAYAEGKDEPQYFALDSRFVDTVMEGQFASSTVILMGCNGLTSPVFADAFIRRGAAHFVSWSDQVTADFTDKATSTLLAHLTSDTPDVVAATSQTTSELGADPAFGSLLVAYP